MIKKLFGGKSEGFFLELDETGNTQTTEPKVEEKQPEPVAATTDEVPESEPVKEESAKTSKKTSIKNKKQQSTTTATSAPTPTPVSSASTWEPPFWVKAMYGNSSSSNGSNGKVGRGEQTFATDNLLPTPSASRRRPGPSLNKFKEMARQAKTPRR